MLQLGKDYDDNDLSKFISHFFFIFCCSTDIYIFVWPLEFQLHTSVVCQPQPTRPHRSIWRGRTKLLAAESTDSSHPRSAGYFFMKIQQYRALQINIVSRFVSKILLEQYILVRVLLPTSAPRSAKDMVTHDTEGMCCFWTLWARSCLLRDPMSRLLILRSLYHPCYTLAVKRDIELQEMPTPLRNLKSISVS